MTAIYIATTTFELVIVVKGSKSLTKLSTNVPTTAPIKVNNTLKIADTTFRLLLIKIPPNSRLY